MKNWKFLKRNVGRFVKDELAVYETSRLTQQVFDMVYARIPALTAGTPVLMACNNRSGGGSYENVITVVGEKNVVEHVTAGLLTEIGKAEEDIQEELSVKETTIPNVQDAQIKYLNLVDFFDSKSKEYKLKSFTGDASTQQIRIEGVPRSTEAVQKEMLELLRNISQSKTSINKRPLFFEVFTTTSANRAIRQQLDSHQIAAVWIVENKTISVYSQSKRISKEALKHINETVWEERYPADHALDELESNLLRSQLWNEKKSHWEDVYQPLKIVEIENWTALLVVGLTHHRASLMEDLPLFLNLNVTRTSSFDANPSKILFLWRFKKEVFAEIEKSSNAQITLTNDNSKVDISGNKDEIADCSRLLQKEHDAIRKEVYVIDHQAMIQHIREDQESLEIAGVKTGCVVVPHEDEDEEVALNEISNRPDMARPTDGGSQFSVRLPSGCVCKVLKADITSLTCDAIVNAANGTLEHAGGLAQAIVSRGTSYAILLTT